MMLDEAQINTALERMADAFLGQPRMATPDTKGWGQFLNQPDENQVGLYGTCAGTIVISLAYGGDRVPIEVVEFLRRRWADRCNGETKGPRDFALTLRLATFYLALRLADRDELNDIVPEVDSELQGRILDDFWVDWQIDERRRSPTASEYAAAYVILAYVLPVKAGREGSIPDFVIRAANRLQSRLKASEPSDMATTRVMLSALVSALPKRTLLRPIRSLVRSELGREDAYHHYSLRFVDYEYLGPAGDVISRRDYSVIPSAALEALMANGFASTQLGKLAALRHAEWLWSRTNPSRFFSISGSVLTASKDQAWVALALDQCRNLLGVDTPWNRLLMRIQHFGLLWNFILPCFVLGFSALLSAAPDQVYYAIQALGWVRASNTLPGWWSYAALALQVLGLIGLAAAGSPLGTRLFNYVRGRSS